MNIKVRLVMVLFILLIISFGTYYIFDYYHADEDVLAYMWGSEDVSVIRTDNGLLLDGPGCNTALIFYPGAKVEYISYLPLLSNISEGGVDCFIVVMPFNLAFFGENEADNIISNNTYNYTDWYMAGHSLGGVAAADYVDNHQDNITGLILLASYSTQKLENTNVLSIYGSNDNILNKESYEENKNNLGYNFTEYVIDGANHAQFGCYGNQSGDGMATISSDEQIRLSSNKILSFIYSDMY